ncbi:MAG: hypothetical protein PHE02_08785 [Lachnospiraceae bacterium]|nr:hypothetical protein [Lachnospiraceae bacterium]
MHKDQKLPGVFIARKKDQTIYYRSSLTFHRKHISLGSFDTMAKAHLAYREGMSVLHTDCSIEDYHPLQLLSFDKWVSLINYRDNGIYFANPIYTRQNYFYYYLSPDMPLIFDIDDLFYYSSHKLMQRKGHLFVSDYGMQYNILNRYGIKNYSVLNRDYRFANGNPHDFRYENIVIMNQFHGITQINTRDGIRYKVKIHVRSYYQVGVYKEETQAAIAYNKAVDILRQNGIHKNYAVNFIDTISNLEYAEIYATLPVSAKLYTLTPDTIKLK